MQSSKRSNPCPMCGRSKDGDCRFDDDVIFCHQGSSSGPPANLQIGDVLIRQGREWALVKTNAGFDGAACVFKPHRPSKKKRYLSNFDLQRQQKNNSLNVARGKQLIKDFIKQARKALKVLEFETAPPDELRHSFVLIESAYKTGLQVKELIKTVLYQSTLEAKDQKELRPYLEVLEDINTQLDYQKKTLTVSAKTNLATQNSMAGFNHD